MLKIELEARVTQFRPGNRIAGSVEWLTDAPPESVELRLFWYTRGDGVQDVKEVAARSFDAPGQQDSRSFSLEFPLSPYSFSGKLVSLVWALELVIRPSGETGRIDLSMSPTGEAIQLAR